MDLWIISTFWLLWMMLLSIFIYKYFHEYIFLFVLGIYLGIFIGRTDAEAEAPILWPPDVKNQFIGKDPDAGKDWRQEEKGTTEDEMVGWHHQLNGHEFEQTPGDDEGQGSLVCCSPWGCKESDVTERLNNKVKETMNRILKYKRKTNTSKNNDVDLGKNQIQVLEKCLA